ncbi:MAG TPA: F0F1 ATP synthase subunit A [Limnochordia bacterium]|nr:F0F1 ATP synthase subunit A [Limnochordia bacterium]
MEPEVVFYIHTFPVTQPLLFTWIIMAAVSIACFFLTRNLKTVPRGAQHLLELLVDGIENLVVGNMGPEGKKFVPLILTIAVYVGISNLIGVVPGAYSPTENLNTTLTLAAIVFLVGHVAAIRKKGLWTWLKGFFQPYFFMFPINLAGEISQVISHAFRLYGNVFGGGILLSIIYMVAPYVLPTPLLGWFGIFSGIIQTAVFTLLAVVYIQIKIS